MTVVRARRLNHDRSMKTVCALSLLLLALPAMGNDDWSFSVTPYLWLPTINGTVSYELPPDSGDGIFDVEIGPNDYLQNLNAVIMVAGEARKDRMSVVSDLVYLDLSSQRSNIRRIDFGGDSVPIEASTNLETDTSLSGMAWTIAGGWSLSRNPDSPMDIIAGVRYFTVESETEWDLTTTITSGDGSREFQRTGTADTETDLWDGIIGLRGRAKIGERWRLPYAVDAGTGSSDLTWQAMGGVMYVSSWGDVGVVYRHLAYDQGDGDMVQDFSFSGPGLAFTFHF